MDNLKLYKATYKSGNIYLFYDLNDKKAYENAQKNIYENYSDVLTKISVMGKNDIELRIAFELGGIKKQIRIW